MKFRNMLGAVVLTLFVALAAHAGDGCEAVYGNGDNLFTLATGSPGELGLLKKLADEFNSANGTTMCWKKAGSGKSLQLLQEKKVDLVLVHAPAAEKKAITDGWAIKRTLIGSNEFYIVGPKDDPAGIADASSATDAYSRIAAHKAAFFSRGDNSGTNKKELSLWKTAGISPAGNWYIITKDFMMATLKRANDNKGYFMTDSSTWVAAQKDTPDLKILFKGDPVLINTYHGLCQPQGATKGQPAASKFIDFIGSPEGQAIIGTYGKDLYGKSMYDDAAYAKQYVH